MFYSTKEKTNKIIVAVGAVLPLFSTFICQKLSTERAFDFNLNVLFLNYILWLAVFLFFISLFKSYRIGLSFYSLFFFLFTFVNRYRIKILNDPLRVNDINLIKELPNILPFTTTYINSNKWLFLVILIFVITFFITINKTVKIKFKKRWPRFVFFIISIIVLSTSYFNKNLFNKIIKINRIVFNPWYRLENCQNNGMLLCYIYDFQFIKHEAPLNYNQKKIEDIMKQASSSAKIENNQIKPNIILILSESLWDVTTLPNIKFKPDPIANIRQDIKGSFISPSYGGGTANVEFELLTGLSNYLFEEDAFPYTDLITKKMPSIFNVFKNNEYLTTVIHPYYGSFYNRNNVYKNFGLDKFISLDQMTDVEKAGPFASDKYFFDQILKQLNSSDQPQFIFGLSMQNHGLYEANRYENKKIKITGNLDKDDRDIFQSYIEGINLTDKSYVYLKESLNRQKDKETIVIMFGDHLPFLSDDFSIYKDGNLVSGDESNWDQKEMFDMHMAPITIWSNYEIKTPNLGNISPQVLSNEILNIANIQPEYQFKFTGKIKDKIPYLTKKVSLGVDENKSLIDDYRLIQYDLLFGKQYIKNIK